MTKKIQIHLAGGTCTIDDHNVFIKRVQRFADEQGSIIQVFNAEKIYGKTHLLSAVHHALRSEKENRMTTNSLEMELFLYASGERQLKLAIPKMGVHTGLNSIAVIIINRLKPSKNAEDIIDRFFSLMDITHNDDVLNGDVNTLLSFGIGPEEINTVSEKRYDILILEKIAIIDIIK